MTAKEYLRQLQRLDIVINQKISEKNELQKKAQSISAVDYSKGKIKVESSGEASFERITDHIYDLENEINSEILRFVDKKHEIINQIQRLKNMRYIDVLFKRYVEFKKLETIATETNYTHQYIRELHSLALRDFEKTYKIYLKTYI